MLHEALLRSNILLALTLVGLLGRASWGQAVTLPDQSFYQDGYSVFWQGQSLSTRI